ncbi:hypothetical protein [Pseudoalteromonas sp. M8]|uniref:hypothetical protein n=1 Tax=Pseudoalteromonas sp. M8 TaxID=2692624 RepID=UPI001BA9FB17|nr:hypothetical protein [Pseudoalteromonas sp. M8]QUI71271.1 hypothetical protein GSF13_16605 [Pseudoalteromonas sp. M8]
MLPTSLRIKAVGEHVTSHLQKAHLINQVGGIVFFDLNSFASADEVAPQVHL